MFKRTTLLVAAIACTLATSAGAKEYTEGTMRDAWLDGKLETAYLFNPHLSALRIDTDVRGGVAYLSGTVESDIDKSLAEEIAKGIDGIRDVKSSLVVSANAPKREIAARMNEHESADKRTFRQWFDDVTTTAAVKARLAKDGNVPARQIDVDTRYDVVTLSGTVTSSEQKDLAGQIARNTEDVKDVHNELSVH